MKKKIFEYSHSFDIKIRNFIVRYLYISQSNIVRIKYSFVPYYSLPYECKKILKNIFKTIYNAE